MRSYLTTLLIIITGNVFGQQLSSASFLAENKLPSGIQRLGKTNFFNQIYFESGVKLSSNTDTIGNLNNSQIGLQHQLTKKLTLFHAYNYLAQDNSWGNITQQTYYANFEYVVNKNFKLNLAGSYLYNKVKLIATTGNTYSKRDNLFFLASATMQHQKFIFKPLVAYSQLDNLTSSAIQYQAGAELTYDIKGNELYYIGVGVYHFENNSNVSTIIKPSLNLHLNDELLLSLDYLYTNAKNYSDQDGYIIYNSVDKTYDRSNLTLRYEFANNVFLYGIYQFERKQYFNTLTNYNFNSIFLGIKYNL